VKSPLEKESPKPPVRTLSLIDQICSFLTESILEGKLKDGERLKELELKEQFKISRSPIREALRELEKRGLVTIIPRRGAFVNAVTFTKIAQNFAARAVLEGLAAREACARMNADDLNELSELMQEMKRASDGKENEAVMKCIYRFHRFFVLKSGNEAVINCLRNLPVHFMWKRFVWAYSQEEMKKAVKRHEKILEAFSDRRGDPAHIEKVVRDQVEDSVERLSRHLKMRNALM
jgi:DNA-binding GntR family transcriptional regulator